MALTEADLGAAQSTTDATSFATGSITPTANRLVLAWVVNTKGSLPDIPTLSGNGITWEQVVTTQINNARRITLFKGSSATPSAGALTASFGGFTQTGFFIAVQEFAGTTTPTVVQSKVGQNTGTVTSAAITLDAAVGGTGTSHATLGCFCKNTSGAYTPGTGFTEFYDQAIATPTAATMAEYDISPADNVIDCTWTSTGNWVGVAAEITDAGAAEVTGAATLTGTGDLTAAGQRETFGASALSGTGALTGTALREALVAAALVGTGDLLATGQRDALAVALLTGAGALTATALADLSAAAVLSGLGTLTATGLIYGTTPELVPPLGARLAHSGIQGAEVAPSATTATVAPSVQTVEVPSG